ncbi:hypothetical protein [Haliovirga abyssi]|uniref:Uncharacterized protein n=1 Tax=Haliovirga abyssi TaxID=2996794 RepID=A0AAU9DMW5_9FUSO|nr:hypothetical protein [Haliovirga abyssi]BDU51387.1 hypothetical protein HLVA_19560 [Haliovirga abyssi]
MKKYYLVLMFMLSFGAVFAFDISGSSLDYSAKVSSNDNYSEKDGEGVLKLNFDNLSLKYSADILNNSSKTDTTMEVIYEKALNNRVKFGVDATLDTANGFEFKLDDDSEKTYLEFGMNKSMLLAIYPFNFGSTVGSEFKTEDITKVYYISGRPTYINGNANGIELGSKTIPGVVLNYRMNKMMNLYIGAGAVEYDTPGDEGFDLTEATKAYSWGKRVAVAYKAGFKYDNEVSVLSVDVVGQDDSEKDGALLKYAAAANLSLEPGNLIINSELVYTQAGEKPYYAQKNKISSEYGYEPYYKQNWVDKGDFAAMLKVGYEVTRGLVPYVSGQYLGENFIYDGENSANRLRAANRLRTVEEFDAGFNDSKSHGGLTVVKAGVKYNYLNATITPFYEYKMAKNAVFSPENDLTAKKDRRVQDLKKTCSTFGLNIKYKF